GELSGGLAPSLVGSTFKVRWNGQSPAALRDYLRRQMPPGRAGALTQDEYTGLVALLLKDNGLAPSEVALPSSDQALAKMRLGFPGVRWSSGGALAVGLALPDWPKAVDPLTRLTPVTDDMLRNPAPGDWLTWRRTMDGQGFSPLTEITAGNVAGLKLVWSHTLRPGPTHTTPLVHDGVVFAGSAGSAVDALDAATGEVLWSYAPDASAASAASRSLALYGDSLFLLKGRLGLAALDARQGTSRWEAKLAANSTGGPSVFAGRVFQGVGSNPGARGLLQAFTAQGGETLWSWSAVPKTGEPGGNSWGDVPDEQRKGAAIWTTSYYDPDLNLLFFGTGNTYDTGWIGLPTKTPGVTKDALFTNSTVALHADTGKLAWYYQHQHGDPFDLDYSFERMVVSLPVNGRMTKAIVTMGKAGVLDALEAATGKYLFSVDAGVQNFITHIDPVTGVKTINPALVPIPGQEKVWTVCPNWIGVKNWLPGAVNPNTKVVFTTQNESCMDLAPVFPGETAALSSGVMPRTRPVPNSDGRYGRVQAMDLQTRKVLWTERQHAPMTSGVLATAGGVVFAGSLDRQFTAYDEKTGRKLWSTTLADVPSAAPIAYSAGGKQYIAVVTGFGSLHSTGFIQLVPDITLPARPGSAIYVFALP
ncbi:MAG: pyrroloquinoline quinone-dependent dehydrogenase, partial [Vicinamibacterales bacterium]